MNAVVDTPEPDTLADALEQLRQRQIELDRARDQLTQARQELEDTNRGLIALHTELQAAQEAEARLAAVVQSSNDAIISMTPDCTVQTWNPGAGRLLGHAEVHVVGQHVHVVMDLESRETFAKSVQTIRQGEHSQMHDAQWRRADGSLVDVAVNVFALHDPAGALIGYSAVARDITMQVEAQRQLERLARFDALTGLVNRAETISRLDAVLTCAREPGSHVGVLYCDVDYFKTINDTWGHVVGDLVLAAVAKNIRECVREGDTVGRMGGDEVLVLLPGVHGIEEVTRIAEDIRCQAAQPLVHDDAFIEVTLSIGATLALPGEAVSSLTARADIAMYEAKRSGRNTVTRI